MGAKSKISWTQYTLNWWRGCTKVSPGCLNCYAEVLVTTRLKGEWGAGRPRQLAAQSTRNDPLRWNRKALKAFNALPDEAKMTFVRPRVFCSSLSDILDPEVPIEWLVGVLNLIEACTMLDWLLLSKRPHLWRARMELAARAGSNLASRWLAGDAPENLRIGATAEDQLRANIRFHALSLIPAYSRFHRFFSCEPLIEEVSLLKAGGPNFGDVVGWVIAGGESLAGARPMEIAWARLLRDQCLQFGSCFHFKQWGEWAPREAFIDPEEDFTKLPLHAGAGGELYRVGRFKSLNLLDGVFHGPEIIESTIRP